MVINLGIIGDISVIKKSEFPMQLDGPFSSMIWNHLFKSGEFPYQNVQFPRGYPYG